MKKIGILSDTHGYVEHIPAILEATKDENISLWLHCGDVADDAKYMQTLTDIPVKMVRGNNDRVKPLAPETELFPFEDTFIYMTHGDKLSYFQKATELRFIARHYQAKLICLGHTHHHEELYIDKTLVVNPGSVSLPRDGSSGTFAIATYENGEFTVEFIEMDEILP